DPEAAVDDGARIVRGAHGGRAAGVVAPGLAADPGRERLVAVDLRAGPDLPRGATLDGAQGAAQEAHAADQRPQVRIAQRVTLVVGAEVDEGPREGIGARELHGAVAVAAPGLEQDPAQPIPP